MSHVAISTSLPRTAALYKSSVGYVTGSLGPSGSGLGIPLEALGLISTFLSKEENS